MAKNLTIPLRDRSNIKDAVRRTYAERATGAGGPSCCAPPVDAGTTGILYGAKEMESLPDTVVNASAGCGNPTALAGLRPGERVLDLGSGGGIDCFLAAQAVGPTGSVTGVDMTSEMIALARDNARKVGAKNVTFVQGEIESMPLPDASFDVIISNCVINLSPDKDAVFREAFRVLAPGGRIHVSDVVAEGQVPEAARRDLTQWSRCIAGADEVNTYLGRIRSAGFADVRVVAQVRYCAADGGMPALASAQVEARKPE